MIDKSKILDNLLEHGKQTGKLTTKEITDADKLKKAMYVMVMGYRSGCLRTEMEKGLEVILDEM